MEFSFPVSYDGIFSLSTHAFNEISWVLQVDIEEHSLAFDTVELFIQVTETKAGTSETVTLFQPFFFEFTPTIDFLDLIILDD